MISGYLSYSLEPESRTVIIDKIIEILAPHQRKFDAFICRGFSSTIPSAILAEHFNKNLVLSRKEDYSHGLTHEGEPNQRCIFVDDFISSGETLKEVYETTKQLECSLYGVYLYRQSVSVCSKQVKNIISEPIKIFGEPESYCLNSNNLAINHLFDVIERRGTSDPLTKAKLHKYFEGKLCVCSREKRRMSWECLNCLEYRPKNGVEDACNIHIEKVVEILRSYR